MCLGRDPVRCVAHRPVRCRRVPCPAGAALPLCLQTADIIAKELPGVPRSADDPVLAEGYPCLPQPGGVACPALPSAAPCPCGPPRRCVPRASQAPPGPHAAHLRRMPCPHCPYPQPPGPDAVQCRTCMEEPPPPPGVRWKGGRSPPFPLQGAQPMPSHCPPDGKCRVQWHL